MSGLPPRILDATLAECVLNPRAPVDAALLAELTDQHPLPDCQMAVAVLAPGAPGAEALLEAAQSAHVVEPVDAVAHAAWCNDQRASAPHVLVDPVGVPLTGTAADADSLVHACAPPPLAVRELVRWTRPDMGPDDVQAGVVAQLDELPAADRLRLRDPFGVVTPALAGAFARLDDAPRLTLVLEDARGLALAAAMAALEEPQGPTVRATLTGQGPRTGYPATELLPLSPATMPALRSAAEAMALVTRTPIVPAHPLWGQRRWEAPEAELTADTSMPWEPRLSPANIGPYLQARLLEWGMEAEPAAFKRIGDHVRARLRPGDTVDDALLYGIVSGLLGAPARASEPVKEVNGGSGGP